MLLALLAAPVGSAPIGPALPMASEHGDAKLQHLSSGATSSMLLVKSANSSAGFGCVRIDDDALAAAAYSARHKAADPGRRDFALTNITAAVHAEIKGYMEHIIGVEGACENNGTVATDIFGGGTLTNDLSPPWEFAGRRGPSWGISIAAAMRLIAETRLKPVQIPLSDVCQKGMSSADMMWKFNKTASGNLSIRVHAAQMVQTCGLKLTDGRCGSLCLDAPVIVLDSTQNPCRARYRLLDGAHRLCMLVASFFDGTSHRDRDRLRGDVGSTVPTVSAFVLSEADVLTGKYNLLRWDMCHREAHKDAQQDAKLAKVYGPGGLPENTQDELLCRAKTGYDRGLVELAKVFDPGELPKAFLDTAEFMARELMKKVEELTEENTKLRKREKGDRETIRTLRTRVEAMEARRQRQKSGAGLRH